MCVYVAFLPQCPLEMKYNSYWRCAEGSSSITKDCQPTLSLANKIDCHYC